MIARFLRSAYRLPAYLIMSAWQVVVLFVTQRRTKGNRDALHAFYRQYIARTQRIMGIEVEQEGELPDTPSLLMANHRSYVDAVLFPSRQPTVFVARSETEHWPIIGWGATLLNTIWVDRKDKDSRRATRERVKERLRDGYSVAIFPEGTTHKGPEVGPYRPSMFYISHEGGFPITPIAIEYEDPEIAWVGSDWFIPHAWKHFGKRRIRVKVKIGQTFIPQDPERARETLHSWATEATASMRQAFELEKKSQRA